MELCTERLILRQFKISDFDAVHSYAGNPENVVYMIWGPNSEEDTENFIKDSMGNWDEDPITKYDFAIIQKDSGRLLGGCGLYLNNCRSQAMLGWILHMDYWRQGYMPEAAAELIRFGFQELKLHRIYATCNADNYGSYRVMEKCGMQREAHFKKSVYGRVGNTEKWSDQYYYAILAEDWSKA